MEKLKEQLLSYFAGRTATMKAIYEEHNVDRPYVEANYKDALKQLEKLESIKCVPPAASRRKDTFGPNVVVSFPSRKA